jgi:uncharacterized protein
MLTYKGLGYSQAFVANMTAVVDRIGQGAPVQVVTGPDDICGGLTAACRAASGHDCGRAETLDLDRIALAEVAGLLGRDLSGPVLARDISRLRGAFQAGTIRGGCAGCPWHDLCDGIAADRFAGARLGVGTLPSAP